MVIGIDGNEANTDKKVGIGEYSFELISQFKEFPISNVQFQIYLKDQPRGDLPDETKNWKYRILKPGKLWTQWRLPLDLYWHKPRPDIFFTPTHYAPRFSPVPTVVSVMDLSYLHFPELFAEKDLYQLKNWTKYSVQNAAHVITISNSSKNDIIKAYNIPKERVSVVYPGIKEVTTLNPHVYSMSELKSKYKISENYILSVGTLQPRKNTTRLIEAFSRVVQHYSSSGAKRSREGKEFSQSSNNNLQLVIVGKKGWLYEDILAAPKKFGVEDRVKFLDFVSGDDLVSLYKNAQCYVFPSLYEGFGLPVLEAMKFDCPVITSNVSSLPEAAGDAALYVNPLDVDDIAKKIEKILEDGELRKELVKKGREQVKKFSWEKSARETLAILQQVARKKEKV